MSSIQPATAMPWMPLDGAACRCCLPRAEAFGGARFATAASWSGGMLTLLMISAALLSLLWTPWPVYEIDMAHKLNPPSSAHWLGTDMLGRDIVSLLMVGARTSIVVGIIAVGIGLSLGASIGLLAAARRGWVEELIMRLTDFTFAFPALLSAIMLAAVAGPGMVTSITAIGIFQIPIFVRITRGSANAIWAREFVLAARASGKGKFRITIEHVLPNILSILIVQATIQFATGDPGGGGAVLSRPRHPAAATVLGPHAQRRAEPAVSVAVAGGVSGSVDRDRRAGAQSVGRWLAGSVRSAAGAGAVMSDKTPLIEVENLRVRLNTSRGPADAVRGVSFSLARGGTLGLIGESGCGKSVTAMALMGLLPDSAVISGSIRLDGQELIGLAEFRLLQTARQPRQHDLSGADDGAQSDAHDRPPDRRAAAPAQGFFGAQARNEAIALLDRVGLPDAAKRVDAYPHQFSGGQRQRITIAMALACEPDLLIADEPTTALDVTIQGQILDLIADLVAERGMSMILISHDLGVIAENVQRMMVMYGGTVVENGEQRNAVRGPRPSLQPGPVPRAAETRRHQGDPPADHPRHRA